MTIDLSKAAMLVSVNIINGGLLGERRDETATNHVIRRYNTGEKRVKTSKYLIDRKHPKVKAVVAASQRVREVLYKYTMPWGDDKTRLLATALHDQFQVKMQEAELDLRAAWEEYLQVYPSLIADSERELGELFDITLYPSVARAKDYFRFNVCYWPLPNSGNFVADISKQAASKAVADMQLEIENRLLEASQSLVWRIRETVQQFLDRMESFKSEKDGKVIRDSLIETIKDVSYLVDEMNVTKNLDITMVSQELRRLATYSAETYRQSPILRSTGKERGKAILKKLDDIKLLDKEVAAMAAEASEYEF